MNPVGHVSDWHIVFRPLGKERFEDGPTHLPVQATHSVDRTAAADGQITIVSELRESSDGSTVLKDRAPVSSPRHCSQRSSQPAMMRSSSSL